MQAEEELCYNNTGLSEKMNIADMKAAYDENVKWLLSEKMILANILHYAVAEYRGLTVEEILPLIEGEPQVSVCPVNPGETNQTTITGDNTESSIPGEGRITFDIRFHSWFPDKSEMIKLLICVEAQKNYFPGYDIVTRGIFYAVRMISAQWGTEFQASAYDEIKKVYTIWICMDVPKYAENTITEYALKPTNLVGNFPEGKSRYDLMSVIIVGLSSDLKESCGEAGLNRLLSVLLSDMLPVQEKKRIMETEYQIPMTVKTDRRVQNMCNLSEAIEERGIERGMETGALQSAISIVRNMRKKQMDEATIADITGKEESLIKSICKLLAENPEDSDAGLAAKYLETYRAFA